MYVMDWDTEDFQNLDMKRYGVEEWHGGHTLIPSIYFDDSTCISARWPQCIEHLDYESSKPL
jgi:hypothetical protein